MMDGSQPKERRMKEVGGGRRGVGRGEEEGRGERGG